MRNVIVLLVLAAVAIVTGLVLMSTDYYNQGALLIYASIILSVLANTQYKKVRSSR